MEVLVIRPLKMLIHLPVAIFLHLSNFIRLIDLKVLQVSFRATKWMCVSTCNFKIMNIRLTI